MNDLKLHELQCQKKIKSSKKVKSIKVQCDICRVTFARKFCLIRHNIRFHQIQTNQGTFYIARKIVKKYLKNVKEYICKVCPILYKFHSKYNLEKHMRNIHQNNSDGIQTRNSFYHPKDEENDKLKFRKITCNFCNGTFSCMQNLEEHMLREHGASFSCNHCLKKFMKRRNLSYHVQQVHGPKSFHCPICTKSFPLKKN